MVTDNFAYIISMYSLSYYRTLKDSFLSLFVSLLYPFMFIYLLGVCRSYVSEKVVLEMRTHAVSRLAALQYAGFAVTPIFGAAIASISPSLKFILPPILLLFLILISLVLILYVFEDISEIDEMTEEEGTAVKNEVKAQNVTHIGTTFHQLLLLHTLLLPLLL